MTAHCWSAIVGARGLAHVVVEREVRPDRHVVPRHEPQAGHVRASCRRDTGRRGTTPDRSASRWIIAPPVSTGIASAKMPRGPSTFLMMSCVGRCHSAFDQSTGGRCCARSNDFDARIRSSLRRVGRKHRPHLVLLAVEPRDEEHLHRAAAIPVALLVVRADAADAGAESLHVHRGVAGMPERRDAHLILGGRRAAGRADLAVRPRLLRQPVDACRSRRSASRGCRSCPRRRSGRARSGRRRRSRA